MYSNSIIANRKCYGLLNISPYSSNKTIDESYSAVVKKVFRSINDKDKKDFLKDNDYYKSYKEIKKCRNRENLFLNIEHKYIFKCHSAELQQMRKNYTSDEEKKIENLGNRIINNSKIRKHKEAFKHFSNRRKENKPFRVVESIFAYLLFIFILMFSYYVYGNNNIDHEEFEHIQTNINFDTNTKDVANDKRQMASLILGGAVKFGLAGLIPFFIIIFAGTGEYNDEYNKELEKYYCDGVNDSLNALYNDSPEKNEDNTI